MKSAIYHGYVKPETRELTPEELDAILPPRTEPDQPTGDVAGYVLIAVAITLTGFVGYILGAL